MHRCGPVFFLTLAISFVVVLTGCLGKSSSNTGIGGVSSVALNPSTPVSLDVGSTQVFSANGKDASGKTVLGVNIQYVVSSATTNGAVPLSVASNGNGCAGTWDAAVAICSPGTPGVATVTAVINGVSSPPTTVYVHQHIDSIQIKDALNQPPYPYDCFSQGKTWQYEAFAFNNNIDISNTVGPMSWSTSNNGVVTTTPLLTGTPGSQVNLVQTTAKAPGITQISASVSGTTSDPIPYTTCLIKAVYLQIGGQSQAGNTANVNSGGSVPVTAIAIDTLYNEANFAPLSAPPLTWSTSNPEVVGFSTPTNSTGSNTAAARSNLGSATITVSCSPPTCNIGLPGVAPSGATVPSLPIYASDCEATGLPGAACPLQAGTKAYSAITVNVTAPATATPPTYTAWAATTGCQDNPGCSSALFSVTPGTMPIGGIVALPRTPNSLMFNHVSASRLYIGSDEGLMYVSISANPTVTPVSSSSTTCNITLCGKVLTISNDGNLVVVSDTISTPNQVYIYNGSSTMSTAPVDLIIPGEKAIAAAFSPDELKLFILTSTGTMYVYSTLDALTSVPTIATSVTDVKFSADGSFAFVAGTPQPNQVSGFATCDTPATGIFSGITTTYPMLPPQATTSPMALYPLPTLLLDSAGNTVQQVLALDPPNVDTFAVSASQTPLADGHFVCNPPTAGLDSSIPHTSATLGQGDFTPVYAELAGNGAQFIVVAENVPAVLLFDVNNGTTSSIPLANSASPIAASASPDGSRVFVAACDQYDSTQNPPVCSVASVHIVNTVNQADIQQVQYVDASDNNDRNMCNNGGNPAPQCLPNLIAVKPD
jgi:hypothetical protein